VRIAFIGRSLNFQLTLGLLLASQGHSRPGCDLDIYGRVAPTAPVIQAGGLWTDRHGITGSVQRAFDLFMKNIDARSREEARDIFGVRKGLHNPADQLQVGATRVTVQALLGVGGEGAVYLAMGPDGPCVLKEFYKKDEMSGNLAGLERHADRGVPTPSVVDKDPSAGRVLLQYIQGIPVDILLNSPGIRAGARHVIREKLAALEAATGVALPENNVVLELSTGKFYLFDSR